MVILSESIFFNSSFLKVITLAYGARNLLKFSVIYNCSLYEDLSLSIMLTFAS